MAPGYMCRGTDSGPSELTASGTNWQYMRPRKHKVALQPGTSIRVSWSANKSKGLLMKSPSCCCSIDPASMAKDDDFSVGRHAVQVSGQCQDRQVGVLHICCRERTPSTIVVRPFFMTSSAAAAGKCTACKGSLDGARGSTRCTIPCWPFKNRVRNA